jgi:hypothetical protein
MRALDFEISKPSFSIDHRQPIALLGSCFSDEISAHFKLNGFDTYANPFGTIFHPSVLARFLNELCLGCEEERTILRDDVWLSWDAGSGSYGMSEEELHTNLRNARTQWKEILKNTSVLFITFGTAWAYNLKEEALTVANCHKFPATRFERGMRSAEEMFEEWEATVNLLNEYFPQLKLVFTVSPVRHSKEGLIENNRSKAELIRLVSFLELKKNCCYFPAYELVIDVLRDYRYFAQDLVHPSEEAIRYVWERLEKTYFNQETIALAKEVRQLKLSQLHRVQHPESKSSKEFISVLNQKKQQLFLDYPFLKQWD